MQYQELCNRIPLETRRSIVEQNMISKAIGFNEYMKFLFDVWYMFIEPDGHRDWECGICRQNVKDNFLQLHDVLVAGIKEQNLLDAI